MFNAEDFMKYKFKIGDIVTVTDACLDQSWYHKNPMKIIGFNHLYYFTDYWNGKEDPKTFHNNTWSGTQEECLELYIGYERKKKLEEITHNFEL